MPFQIISQYCFCFFVFLHFSCYMSALRFLASHKQCPVYMVGVRCKISHLQYKGSLAQGVRWKKTSKRNPGPFFQKNVHCVFKSPTVQTTVCFAKNLSDQKPILFDELVFIIYVLLNHCILPAKKLFNKVDRGAAGCNILNSVSELGGRYFFIGT